MTHERVCDGLVNGTLHRSSRSAGRAIVLAHGAGSNSESKLLVALSRAFADNGVDALRLDLPYRVDRPSGPPHPSGAARDREGLRQSADLLRRDHNQVYLGGHSYGGRQASMLASEEPTVADGLLLLSYPLHPPRKPTQMRTEHLSKLIVRCLFVHGTRDPFGTTDEIRGAVQLIPGPTELYIVQGAGHELKPVIQDPSEVVQRFLISAT